MTWDGWTTLDKRIQSGDFFSHSLGYIGGFAMLGTQLYRLRRFTGTPAYGGLTFGWGY